MRQALEKQRVIYRIYTNEWIFALCEASAHINTHTPYIWADM